MSTNRSITVASPLDRAASRPPDPMLSNGAFAIFFIVTILIATTMLLAPKAHAVTRTYDAGGSTTTDLNIKENWSGDTVPTTSDEALFTTLPATAATFSVQNTNPTYGDLIWNQNTSSNIINSNGNRTLTLSGNGGSTAAIAAGGATGDLITLGTNATSNTLTIGSSSLSLAIGKDGQFNVVNSGATLNIAGALSGNFNLTKTGAGTLTLSGNNTFGAGKTFTLSAGTLNINSATALGSATNTFQINGGTTINNTSGASITISNNNPLTINGDFTFTGSNSLNLGTGAATLGTASGTTRTITVSANTLTLGGAIANGTTANSLLKNGGGTLALSGASTYSGGTFFGNAGGSAAGTLALGSSSVGAPGSVTSGPIGTGTLTLRGTGASSIIRSTDATARTINNAIVFSGTSIDIHFGSSTTGDLTFGGSVDLGGGVRTVEIDNANTTFSGAISGTAGNGLTKAGTGTLILSGTSANTYNGTTTVNAGMLDLSKTAGVNAVAGNLTIGDGTGVDIVRLVNSNQIADTSVLTFNGTTTNAGTFRMNAQSETVGGISSTGGAGIIENGTAGSSTLTVNNSSAQSFSGIIQNGAAGTLALAKSGSGTQTLSGNNTYTGTTTINSSGGTLEIANSGSSSSGRISGTSAITVNSGGTLLLSGSSSFTNRINDSATMTLAGGTFNTGGLSEVNGPAGSRTAGIGALTLTANSTINFGSVSSIIEFAGLGAHTPTIGPDLSITNWTGTQFTPGGTDQLLFAGVTSDFTSKFSQSDVSFNGVSGYAVFQITPNYFEVTAVPEPSTWIGGALALGAVGFTQRRRFARLVRHAP